MNERQNSDYIYCSKCGRKNSTRDNFCTNCGTSLKTLERLVKNTAIEVKENIKNSKTYKEFTDKTFNDGYSADFNNKGMINFIQKKVEYYIPKFKEIQELSLSTSWNWAAFFFNSWWFLYRKMYAYGFGIIAASFIITAIMPIPGLFLDLIIAIGSGLLGNIMYFNYVQKQLKSVESMEEELRERTLLNRGGVNIVIPVILVVIIIGLFLLVGALGAFFYMFSSPYYY